MYVLVNGIGAYLMDIDERGYIAVTPYLNKAIKYLSYESAVEDSKLTKCTIKLEKECEKKTPLTNILK